MRMASEALLGMDTCIMSHGSVQANKGQAMRLQFLVKNRAEFVVKMKHQLDAWNVSIKIEY